MRIINWFFGLFGYEWVKETEPKGRETEAPLEIVQDEDWEDVYETVPHYVLRKKPVSRN